MGKLYSLPLLFPPPRPLSEILPRLALRSVVSVGDRLVLLGTGIWAVSYMALGVMEPVAKPNTSLLEIAEEGDGEEDDAGEVNGEGHLEEMKAATIGDL